MAHPYLAFCPYLSVNKIIAFADWEIGPLNAFDKARWTDQKFRNQSAAFVKKFVGGDGEPVENPSIVCRRNAAIDGAPPSREEREALEAAIAFSFLDENPRNTPATNGRSWAVLTSDNTELLVWPVDVDEGYLVVTTGLMVRTKGTGYQIADKELNIRPPLDLHAPLGKFAADEMCLEAVYKTVLQSAQAPGASLAADRLRVAIGWFAKAWRNTATLHFPERVVFLKTAFEALTGTDKSYKSARALRLLFEAIPDTSPSDCESLVWSPAETPIHTRTYQKNGQQVTEQITDLEHWFMAFANARNQIIHEGTVPLLEYKGLNPPNSSYDGHFGFTA